MITKARYGPVAEVCSEQRSKDRSRPYSSRKDARVESRDLAIA